MIPIPKNGILTVIVLVFYSLACRAQVVNFEGSKESSFLYAKYNGIAATLNLGDKGFILVIGSEISTSYQVLCFDAEGKLIWKKHTEREYGIGGKAEAFLVTPDYHYFYYIQVKGDRFYDKKTYVHQIALDGTEKKFEIEGKEEFGKQLQAIFCDKNFLYFATTEDGNEYRDKKKVTEKLILNRFDHQAMTPKTSKITTPTITEGDETSFWAYVGQRDDIKFFTSKHVNTDLAKNDFTIIGVNPDGEVKSNVQISMTLPSGKFTRPSYAMRRHLIDASEVVRVDYKMKPQVGTSTNSSTIGRNSLIANPTCFGQVAYDSNTDGFLVYGLYGPKAFRNFGPVYQGFYLYKYDLNGRNQWKTEQPAGSKLMDVGYFRVHSTPVDREVTLQTLPDKRILFTIGLVDETKVPFLFSAEGKFIKSDFIDRMKKLDYQPVKILGLSEDLKSLGYITTTLKEEKGDLSLILNPKGEVLIYFPSKSDPIKTIYFKK